ncbi:MAG: HAD hydrolase family protein [Lentisphaeria bacterium]|nr:HAD hydrolase family protein [Lentisphaeria bacterium]
MDWSKASKIKALILDVDGVLTDGTVGYTPNENIKFFNIRDGLAIVLAIKAGLKVGIISGRADEVNVRRMNELKMHFGYFGRINKSAALDELLEEHNLTEEECAYIGDDVIDIPPVRRVEIGCAVQDAVPELLTYADYHCTHKGGQGAVREVIVEILKAKGLWEEALEPFTNLDS